MEDIRFKQKNSHDPDLQPQDWILAITKKNILTWNEEIWNHKLKGSTLKRVKPWMWRRNALAMPDENRSQ